MKIMSRCLLAALTLALTVSLSGCGDDDDKDGANNGNGTGSGSYATTVSDFCKKHASGCEKLTTTQCEEAIAYYSNADCQKAYATYMNCLYSVLEINYCTDTDVLENMTEEQMFTVGLKCLNESQSYVSTCGYK